MAPTFLASGHSSGVPTALPPQKLAAGSEGKKRSQQARGLTAAPFPVGPVQERVLVQAGQGDTGDPHGEVVEKNPDARQISNFSGAGGTQGFAERQLCGGGVYPLLALVIGVIEE